MISLFARAMVRYRDARLSGVADKVLGQPGRGLPRQSRPRGGNGDRGQPDHDPHAGPVHQIRGGKHPQWRHLGDLALSPDGTRVVQASGAPYEHPSFTVPSPAPSTVYRTTNYPLAAEWNASGSHLIAAVDGGPDIRVFAFGHSSAIGEISLEGTVIDRGVALSADAGTFWALIQWDWDGPIRFVRGSTAAPGAVTGRLTAEDGGALANGGVALYDADSRLLVAETTLHSTGRYTFDELAPGSYFVLGVNADGATLWDYFPEWYDDVPLALLDRVHPVEVKSGKTTSGIDIELQRLFGDMFNTPFTGDILWMRYTGISPTGCSNGNYCPDAFVTRGQMAAFLARALNLTDSDPSIEFKDDSSSPFEAHIGKLATANVTAGCTADRFCPDDYVTRAQMAAFLVRAMRYTDPGSVHFTDDYGSVFEADIENSPPPVSRQGAAPGSSVRRTTSPEDKWLPSSIERLAEACSTRVPRSVGADGKRADRTTDG